jgi:hypothetical protein
MKRTSDSLVPDWDGGWTASGSAAGGRAGGPCAGSAGISACSDSGPASVDDRDSTTRGGGAAAGMATVRRCIRTGIAREAASTMVHTVI